MQKLVLLVVSARALSLVLGHQSFQMRSGESSGEQMAQTAGAGLAPSQGSGMERSRGMKSALRSGSKTLVFIR